MDSKKQQEIQIRIGYRKENNYVKGKRSTQPVHDDDLNIVVGATSTYRSNVCLFE
jgi:hypothetical protein